MIRVLGFLFVLVLHGANAQFCVPDPVTNVTLNLDYILHWTSSTNCEETHYLVYVHLEDDLQYIFTAEDNALEVSFLPACERFYFEVRAFSNEQTSDAATLTSYIPAPSGADLTITTFSASVQEGNATFLNWQVEEKFAHCARAFRVVIRDSFTPIPRDVYTDRNNLFLNNLIPCGQYEFGVTAIYNLESEGPIKLLNYSAPQARSPPPVLESVVTGDTYAHIGWSLPSYSVNRCPIRSLIVDGLPFLHQIFPVSDTPARPLYTMDLNPLVPDNMYILRVTIVNTAGSSDIYPIGVQTLPAL